MTGNAFDIAGDSLFIRCTNVYPLHQWVTASVEDRALLDFRWRIIDGKPTTTVMSSSVEVAATIDHVLFNVHRSVFLPRKDGNPLNASRDNVRLTSEERPNTIITNGNVAMLLIEATTILLDANQVSVMRHLRWRIVSYRGQQVVVSSRKDADGVTRKIQLPRLLLNLTDPKQTVRYRSTDRFDYRMSNLYVG